MVGARLDERPEHPAVTAEIDAGDTDPDDNHGRDHQHVLDDGDPGRSPYSAGENESAGQEKGQKDSHVGADRPVARNLDDKPEADELELEIGNDGHDTDDRHNDAEAAAPVSRDKKIGLGGEAGALPAFPDRRENKEGSGVGQGGGDPGKKQSSPG